MGSRRESPITATSSPYATTHSSCSTISEIAKVQCFDRATSTALSGGGEALEPVVERYQGKGVRLLFRADAAFAKPEVYEFLESRDIGYAMRLPANEVLQRHILHLLKRPVGRPPKKPVVWYHDFKYQAKTWGGMSGVWISMRRPEVQRRGAGCRVIARGVCPPT